MNNLKLVTTETFGDLSCNFYRNMNDNILLTREQIGQALEYVYPDDALSKIHKRHKDRLDLFSVVARLASTDEKEYDTILYSERGVMEICRWSNKPKANEFMDWVWDIIESYRHNELDISPLTEAITTLTQTVTQMQQEINNLKSQSIRSTESPKPLPSKTYSRWKTNTFEKLKLLTEYVNNNSDQELKLSDTLHITINEMQDTYEIELSDYTQEYILLHSSETQPYALDVINYYKDLRKLYNTTLDSIMDRLNLVIPRVSQNIFDILAQNMA